MFLPQNKGLYKSQPLVCGMILLLFPRKLPIAAPLVKRQIWKIRRFSRFVNIKIIFPLKITRAHAEVILNRYSSCVSKPLPVSTSTLVKPAALMAAAASSKPKVRLLMSWESDVIITLPPIFCHSPSSHAPG